ncbi:MAG: PEP/pyruvate-binding domain-containing protein [Woeseiaceae bacterium]|nr:PEP/pyruvate-binding domain-containing protein [Woeseiaceae bacterium]
MAFIHFDAQINDPAFAGNKAFRLAELKAAGFRVPSFFVIGPHAAHEICRATLRSEIAAATESLGGNGQRLAVRSSSADEDGSEHSYAGQFSSYLNIAAPEVCDYAFKVWDSATSEQLTGYREANGVDGQIRPPSVLVQNMVDADAAGVAFAVDPITGERDAAVVAAVRGVGEVLVSGERQGDTWRVSRRGRISARELETAQPVLTDRQVRKIARLARRVSRFCGTPQDIEWAIANGRLWLLQSRDITALDCAGDDYALWDNSNIVESYGGVTTPLTFSVARSAYQEAYRHFGRVLGVGERNIARHQRTYEQMIGLIQGRVYYNLLNWYRLLMLTPGFRFNRKFMEQMMGVTQGLPKNALPDAKDASPFATIFASVGMLRVARRLLTRLIGHDSRVRRFHQRLDAALAPVELAALSLGGLLDYYEALEKRVIPAWDTPLINDLYCMIFHGSLRALCERWLEPELAGIHNDLVAGDPGMISLEPVTRMQRMAANAAGDKKLVRTLCSGSTDAALRAIRSRPGLCEQFDAYLERFGDRCLDELKLESQTLGDDPATLLRAVGQLAKAFAKQNAQSRGADAQANAMQRVRACLSPMRRIIFTAILKLAGARLRDRENLRFERTRVYGRVRAVFVEIGRRLAELGVVESPDDIFYLGVEEIRGIVRGTGCSGQLATLVACRRREFAAYRQGDAPPRRFITRGPAQLPASMQPAPHSDRREDTDCRTGQACSAGVVRGPVRIVRDPRTARVREGEILVAERTDPGWVMIFPLVSGMIMERGSLLSHSAIVARELGIPAVVGVDDACSWLEDGDWVELDGANGTITRIAEQERAA